MSPFTDEDTTKLKKQAHERGCVTLTFDGFSSLLARLEAAEKALLNSEYQECNEYIGAWLKASGKLGSNV